MSTWRDATHQDLAAMWPAARSAHVFTSLAQLLVFSDEAPWRVRIASDGAAIVLRRWRGHLDTLSIRVAWGAPWRMNDIVEEARRLARENGFADVISPLLAGPALEAYQRAGMHSQCRLLAYTAVPSDVIGAIAENDAVTLRPGTLTDASALLALDAKCFNDFWRYGPPEFETVFGWERVVVAEGASGVVGYSTCAISGSSCTLGRLAVDPDARRQGIASALVRDVALYAREQGALGMSLCTQVENEGSQALYEAARFRRVGDVYAIAAVDA